MNTDYSSATFKKCIDSSKLSKKAKVVKGLSYFQAAGFCELR